MRFDRAPLAPREGLQNDYYKTGNSPGRGCNYDTPAGAGETVAVCATHLDAIAPGTSIEEASPAAVLAKPLKCNGKCSSAAGIARAKGESRQAKILPPISTLTSVARSGVALYRNGRGKMRTVLVATLIGLISSPAIAAPLDPCRLLTNAQVASALGERSVPGERQPSAPGQPTCGWKAGSKTLYVMLASHKTMPPPWWKSAVVVRGVGDSALWSGGWMYVRKGSHRVAIELLISPSSVTRMDPQLVKLAKEIAARM